MEPQNSTAFENLTLQTLKTKKLSKYAKKSKAVPEQEP